MGSEAAERWRTLRGCLGVLGYTERERRFFESYLHGQINQQQLGAALGIGQPAINARIKTEDNSAPRISTERRSLGPLLSPARLTQIAVARTVAPRGQSSTGPLQEVL